MSQLAGVYRFDGQPLDRAARQAALSPFATPRSKQLPGFLMAWDETTGMVETPDASCVLDGRVDRTNSTAASALALQLYRDAGAAGLATLIGDWSLAIWDERRRAIVLASDYAGTRPLYYFHSSDCVAWSSSLDHLARWMDCRSLDRDYVSAFLRTGYPGQLTPYHGIRPVPAGGAVALSAEGAAVTEIWSPPPAESIRYRDESEYEEQFRVLFRDAVAVRLQTGAPAAAELSGGLDSSSIVCMADHLIQAGVVPGPGLATFSYFTPDSPDHRYIGIAEKACRAITPVHLEASRFPILTPATPGSALPIWAETRLFEVRRRMQENGLGVLLTGQCGDLITGNFLDDSEQAADCFRRGQVAGGVTEALAWSQSLHIPVYGVIYRAARNALAALTYGSEAGSTPSQRKRLGGLSELRASRFFQCPEPLTGILYSHPFTHRPLVEFLLAIPPGILCRPGEPRRLMRRSLQGIVPEAILRRRSKGNYEGMFLESLRPCAAELLRSSRELWLAQMGWIDRRLAAARLRMVSDGRPFPIEFQQVIRLEHWIRRSVRRGAIAAGDLGLSEMGITGLPEWGL